MGGAADPANRSSSPLKRPASDLEADVSKDDVDMINVPDTDPTLTSPQTTRTGSVDMMDGEQDLETPLNSNGTSSPKPESGMLLCNDIISTANFLT